MIRFIGLAEGDQFALRAALYEFHYQPVANAFAKAVEAGADVKIVYDAESTYKEGNEATIATAGLDQTDAVIPRTVTEGIRHNKFIVLLKDEKPIAVWTGSTNISNGGIFGHSNVGHIVWDRDVAKVSRLLEAACGESDRTKLRRSNRAASPLPAGAAARTASPRCSARATSEDSSDTLQWYADRMAEAKQIVCFTVAFNIDKVFQQVLAQDNDVLRYIVKDDDLGDGEIDRPGPRRDLFAAGGYLGEGALANFLKERSNPLESQRLHPQQVHAGRSARRRSARDHRLGELQPAVAADQRREHAGRSAATRASPTSTSASSCGSSTITMRATWCESSLPAIVTTLMPDI